MPHLSSVTLNDKDYTFATPIFECMSSASVSNKEIDLTNVEIEIGSTIRVRFIYGNTCSTITLNSLSVKSANNCSPSKYTRENCLMTLIREHNSWLITG